MREKSKKIQSERYLQSKIKVVVSIFFILFFVGFVSSDELIKFDNGKSYDSATKTITIQNTFNLGRTFADIKLNTPLNVQTGYGDYFKGAEFTVTNYENYTNALEGIKFYNINKNMEEIQKDFILKYKTTEEVDVEDYKYTCVPDETNKTSGERCYNEVIGTHKVTREVWLPLEKYDFLEGEVVTIGIYVYMNKGDNIEWIMTAYGKDLTEWASMSASMKVSLFAYYKMDDGSGTIANDELNYFDGIATQTRIFNGLTGKLGTSANFIQTDDTILLNGTAPAGTIAKFGNNGSNIQDGSVNVWFKAFDITSDGGAGAVWIHTTQGEDRLGIWLTGGNSINWGCSDEWRASNRTNLTSNQWYMATLTWNGATKICKGYIDGVLVASNAYIPATFGNNRSYFGSLAASNWMNGTVDEAGFWTRTITQAEIYDLYSGGNGLSFDETPVPQVTLNSPVPYYNSSSANVTFDITVTDAQNVSNVTLYIDDALNETQTSYANGTYLFSKILSEGLHNWSIIAYNNNSQVNNSGYRNVTIDITTPILTITYPTNTSYITTIPTSNNVSVNLNWTTRDTNRDMCWYSTDRGTTNKTITCDTNVTWYFSTYGIQQNLTVWGNDTANNLGVARVSALFDYFVLLNSINYTKDEIYITENSSYWINASSNTSLTSANLYLNGTRYTGVNQSVSGTSSIWNTTFELPTARQGNNSVIWELTYAGTAYNTTAEYQQIANISWTVCDATYTTPYHNITFKDESNSSSIKGDVPASTWVYYLGSGVNNKTYTYSTSTFNDNYTICFSPPNRTVYVDYSIQYSGITYPQRTYNPDVLSFNNSIINKTLYLLPNADGIYVTFQVINTAEQPIEGVYVNASRDIGGTTTMVSEGTTGADGGVTFWLNPDFTHTFMFVKSGYTTYVSTFQPTQSLYTVSLGTETSSTNYDYTKAINIFVTPTNNSLYNDTYYNFSVTLTSSYWTVSSFNFTLFNGTSVFLNSSAKTTNGGTIWVNTSTSGNKSIIMEFYYVVNGTYTNYTYYWSVLNTEGTDWSIKNFASDLKSYVDSGMFGLETGGFAFGILMFLIIMVSTGIMSYKFGLTSPATISAAIFAIVFLLDVGLGLLDALNPVGAINHFPTIFTAIVVVGLIIRESVR